MDRRQNRTRKAVFQAMAKLLAQKHFDRITVQEIIDEADIGRSTFYSHFETKEHLLRALCEYIFEKIHSQAVTEDGSRSTLETMLVRVLYQGKKYRQILQGMYTESIDDLCERYIRSALEDLFREYLPEMALEVPERFEIYFLTSSFAGILRWWVMDDCPGEPEELVGYYLKLIRI